MFGFLKKKIKESIESVKKVFKEEPREEKETTKEEFPSEKPKEDFKEEIKEIENLKENVEEKEAETPEEKKIKKIEKEVFDEVKEELKEEVALQEEKVETPKIEILKEIPKGDTQKEIEKDEEEINEIEKLKKEVETTEAKTKEDAIAKESEEEVFDEVKEELQKEIKEKEKPKPKKEGFFKRIFGKKKEPKKEVKKVGLFEKRLSEEEFEKFFKKIEISFLEANIAYGVIKLIKDELKKKLVDNPVKRGKVEEKVIGTIQTTFEKILLEMKPQELIDSIEKNKKRNIPTKILFLGVNGVGKTTNMCKMGYWLKQKGYSIVLAASDTFRAASIEQLEKHAEKLGVRVIKHNYGADPAAVAYDAIEYAKAHNIDVVLIDSAGRQHSNTNLMDELAKIKRVSKPDLTIFVADALTGNDAIEQAREFGKIGFDAIILGKADVDQKGGAILSVSYISKKPILFLGTGQDYKDLEPFDKEKIIKKLVH